MVSTSLAAKLYQGNTSCLNLPIYEIEEVRGSVCGPCYFREGYREELPSRVTIREYSGLFGAPQYHPALMNHLSIYLGLVPPEPGENLRNYRRRRSQRHHPSSKSFPFISALWYLMGYQPPLAKVLKLFCEGYNEAQIADYLDISLYNAQERLNKAVRTSQQFLWRKE